MADEGFDFDKAIRVAQLEIDRDTASHELRCEFWKGYQSAMREVQQTWRPHDADA